MHVVAQRCSASLIARERCRVNISKRFVLLQEGVLIHWAWINRAGIQNDNVNHYDGLYYILLRLTVFTCVLLQQCLLPLKTYKSKMDNWTCSLMYTLLYRLAYSFHFYFREIHLIRFKHKCVCPYIVPYYIIVFLLCYWHRVLDVDSRIASIWL
jgi:hypothetical protein